MRGKISEVKKPMPTAPRVLIAEDEPHIVSALTFLLDRAGFDVRVESDGSTALKSALSDPPSVMVVDVMLPGIDGFEIVRRLRAEPGARRLPILMLTAKGQARDRRTADEAGVDAFISKPFSNAEVVETVTRLAGVRQ